MSRRGSRTLLIYQKDTTYKRYSEDGGTTATGI